jgi:hypothetical protein
MYASSIWDGHLDWTLFEELRPRRSLPSRCRIRGFGTFLTVSRYLDFVSRSAGRDIKGCLRLFFVTSELFVQAFHQTTGVPTIQLIYRSLELPLITTVVTAKATVIR